MAVAVAGISLQAKLGASAAMSNEQENEYKAGRMPVLVGPADASDSAKRPWEEVFRVSEKVSASSERASTESEPESVP